MMERVVFLIAIMLLVIEGSVALTVGVSPGSNNLGTLERGETIESEFYLQTDLENLQVDPQVETPTKSFLMDGNAENYGINPREYSSENVEDWISFKQPVYYEDGSVNPEGLNAYVDGKVGYFLDVPQDAEPGYHAVRINPNPDFPQGEATLSMRSISNHIIIFRIPGEAERDLQVQDVRALRTGDSTLELRADVKNTGTVTMTVTHSQSSIFSDSQGKIGNFGIGGYKIGPGETKTMSGGWYKEDGPVRAGNYEARGTMNYVTGQAFFEDSMTVTDYIQIEDAGNDTGGGIIPGESSNNSPPVMLIFIALVLSGTIMYAFEIDPLLIILALGVITMSSVIWFTAIPTYLVGLIVLLSAGLFYYGWM